MNPGESMSLRPLVVICGTTGVGKSKLAIELALRLAAPVPGRQHNWRGARIINADSMQVYKGMDVITNKVPKAEQQGIEHLLMGFKQPGEQYVVGEWVRDTMRAVDETYEKQKLPIVVGGTSYWIQHLLFPDRLPSAASTSHASEPPYEAKLSESVSQLAPASKDLFSHLPKMPPSAAGDPEAAFALFALLKELDEPSASRWHWKDTRKVLRSLEIIKETGKRASDVISEQSQAPVQPRYRALCFWLYANPDTLFPRLDERVDEMIGKGLLSEIQELRAIALSNPLVPSTTDRIEDHPHPPSPNTDYTLGIYQCIGYKEFRDYLASSAPHSPVGQKLFSTAVDAMKLSTQQYAKRQVGWLRNKFIPAARTANAVTQDTGVADAISTFLLDATELDDRWTTSVKTVAEDILEDFLDEKPLPEPKSLSSAAQTMLTVPDKPTDPLAVLSARRKIICPLCTTDPQQPVMIEEGREWEGHRRTKIHKHLARIQNGQDRHPRSGGPRRAQGVVQHSAEVDEEAVASLFASADLSGTA